MNAQEIDYGPCCACGRPVRHAAAFVQLRQKAPVPGTGWGCTLCGLPDDGAWAVVCNACYQQQEAARAAARNGQPGPPPIRIRQAIYGAPELKARTPVSALESRHEHDMSKHPEAFRIEDKNK